MKISICRHSDSYVRSKLGSKYWISGEIRAKLCEQVIESDAELRQWLSVTRGELQYPNGFADFDVVTREFAEFLNDKNRSSLTLLESPLKVVYICGLDHFNKCPYVAALAEESNVICVVIYRVNADEERIKDLSKIQIKCLLHDFNRSTSIFTRY